MRSAIDPHGEGRVATGGAPLARAAHAMILLHGRGGSPEDMLGLADHLALSDVACFAPAAAGGSWWPQSFLAPLAANEPALSSALAAVERVSAMLADRGFGPDRTIVLGFSQGACLALEYAARSGLPRRAVVGFSGALVGSHDASGASDPDLYGYRPKAFEYDGRLTGTEVLLGCHELDPHIPLVRMRTSASTFEALGADIVTRIHPGSGHAIEPADIAALHAMLGRGSGPRRCAIPPGGSTA